MDGVSTMSEIRQNFRTPLRILVPKIFKSRDAWKAKSDRRKAQLKAAQIKVRDLTLSRERWKQNAASAQGQLPDLRAQLQQCQNELAQTRTELAELQEAKKN